MVALKDDCMFAAYRGSYLRKTPGHRGVNKADTVKTT